MRKKMRMKLTVAGKKPLRAHLKWISEKYKMMMTRKEVKKKRK